MRIAVTYEKGQVFQHFGHTERFKVYDVEKGKGTIATVVNTNGSGHGALADILKKIGADTLICGSLGDGARRALTEAGIRVFAGVTGEADKAVEELLAGRLRVDEAVCEHQGERHDGGCGEHCSK